MLERLVAICIFFGGSIIQSSKTCITRRRTVYAIRIAVNRFFLEYGSFKKDMPSRASRGYRS